VHAQPHHAAAPVMGSPSLNEEGVRVIQDAFQNPKFAPHWPMYLRNVKQFIKNAAPTFDERKYGFANFLEAVRAAQKAGILKLDRNRQGILRVYPGTVIPQPPRPSIPHLSEETQREVERHLQEPVTVEAEPVIEAAPVQEIIDVPVEAVTSDSDNAEDAGAGDEE